MDRVLLSALRGLQGYLESTKGARKHEFPMPEKGNRSKKKKKKPGFDGNQSRDQRSTLRVMCDVFFPRSL